MHDVVPKRSRVAMMTRARTTIWTGKHRKKLPECTGVFDSGPALLTSSSSAQAWSWLSYASTDARMGLRG
jgi:hypothetical protein